jgi:MSHA biogenesis protein MshP
MTARNHFPFLQRGVSVISAIFIMLLMGVIAALMVNLMSTAHMTSAQDVEGSRAYQAAQAGVEWGLYQVLDPLNTTVLPVLPPCPPPPSFPPIDGFAVAVTCQRFPDAATVYTEGDRSITVYHLTATASKGTLGMPDFIERQVSVTASKCRSPSSTAPGNECQ